MSTIRRQRTSLAFLHAEWIPMLSNCTAASIPLSQVRRGRPQGLLQRRGGRSHAPSTLVLILVDVTDTKVVPAYYGHDRRVYSTDPL